MFLHFWSQPKKLDICSHYRRGGSNQHWFPVCTKSSEGGIHIYIYYPASLAVLEKRRWLCYNKHLQFLCFKKQEIIEFRKFHAGNICRLWQAVHGPTFYMNAIQLGPTSRALRPLLEKHQTLSEYQMQAKLGICVEVAKLMRLECLWKLNNHVFWF